MLDGLIFALILLAALGSGLVGGVFFAFSTFIMQALDRLPAANAIAAMQSINRVVLNPVFLGPFIGTVVVCLALVAIAFLHASSATLALILIGALAYVAGTFAVTIACNVPRNEALEQVEPDAADAVERWQRYCREWTFWNHVRTIAALAAAVCFVIAAA
jgi:uncharacterized membrane protein